MLIGISVILDSDVAELYGEVIKIFDNPKIKFSPSYPTSFTEKGLYVLATILKSPRSKLTPNYP